MKNRKKVLFSVIGTILTCVVIFKVGTILVDKYNTYQKEQKKASIEYTLYKLGNRSIGTRDWNTAQYSMALGFVETAALGESLISNYNGMNKEEIKAQALESLKMYFETDYIKSYAAMIFGADYFTQKEMECFYEKTISSIELKERMEELLYKNDISLNELLINSYDKEICYTVNLHIKLAGDGCIDLDAIIAKLKGFVLEGEGIAKVSEEQLAKGVLYESIVSNYASCFSDEKIYFDELSPVGKMVFLHLMPRYVLSIDQEAGSELWYYCFEALYEKQWNEIIQRPIFSEIVE